MDTLYRDEDVDIQSIPEAVLKKLLLKATTEVKFCMTMKCIGKLMEWRWGHRWDWYSPTFLWAIVKP